VRKMIVKCEDCHKPIDTEKDEYVRRHVYREGKYANTPVFINADKIRINQVIDNLLTNAIKFTDEGAVSISIACKKGKNHMDRIIVSVRDTGTGIHPEILKIVLKICYPKRYGYWFGIIHFKEYCGST
jgi:signal transduction histidine kinase